MAKHSPVPTGFYDRRSSLFHTSTFSINITSQHVKSCWLLHSTARYAAVHLLTSTC
ncbi:Uncharacterized protein DAT39_007370 [Clarias magur]|uniref:Uncharacterized protein n=1 Tax=Clarias magur TaxID=1594786 RepID=A0A8J4U2U8_CLAMG|nr:Uncharacterized protein DAT39_007370 [Clarias magur]